MVNTRKSSLKCSEYISQTSFSALINNSKNNILAKSTRQIRQEEVVLPNLRARFVKKKLFCQIYAPDSPRRSCFAKSTCQIRQEGSSWVEFGRQKLYKRVSLELFSAKTINLGSYTYSSIQSLS